MLGPMARGASTGAGRDGLGTWVVRVPSPEPWFRNSFGAHWHELQDSHFSQVVEARELHCQECPRGDWAKVSALLVVKAGHSSWS